jgi:hypothetical protein
MKCLLKHVIGVMTTVIVTWDTINQLNITHHFQTSGQYLVIPLLMPLF